MAGQPGVLESSFQWMTAAISPGRRQGEVAAAAAAAEFDHVPKADVQDDQGQGHPNAFGFARKGLCSRAMRLAA